MSKRVIYAIATATVCTALLLSACSRESADWKQAGVANTPEAYQAFLQQHPHGADAAQAQARLQQLIEQRDWQIASTTDSRDGYQQFITRHPDSKWVQEARIRIENFAQAGVSGGAALAATGASAEPAGGGAAPASSSLAAETSVTQSAPGSVPAPAAAPPGVPAAHSSAVRGLAAHRPRTALLARTHRAERSNSRLLQLGSFRSKARAESEWRQLRSRFSPLKSLTPRYVVARTRGSRVYRLQVRVSSARAASGVCATLRRHARPCMRVNA